MCTRALVQILPLVRHGGAGEDAVEILRLEEVVAAVAAAVEVVAAAVEVVVAEVVEEEEEEAVVVVEVVEAIITDKLHLSLRDHLELVS